MKTKNIFQITTLYFLTLSISVPGTAAEKLFIPPVKKDIKELSLHSSSWSDTAPDERNYKERIDEIYERRLRTEKEFGLTPANYHDYRSRIHREEDLLNSAAFKHNEKRLKEAKDELDKWDRLIYQRKDSLAEATKNLVSRGSRYYEHVNELNRAIRDHEAGKISGKQLALVKQENIERHKHAQSAKDSVDFHQKQLDQLAEPRARAGEAYSAVWLETKKLKAELENGTKVLKKGDKGYGLYVNSVRSASKRLKILRAAATAAGVALGLETIAGERPELSSSGTEVQADRFPALIKRTVEAGAQTEGNSVTLDDASKAGN